MEISKRCFRRILMIGLGGMLLCPGIALASGADVGEALSGEEILEFSARYADDEAGSMVARSALEFVGTAYSQEMRYSEHYVDCSSFVERALRKAEISLGGTAAEQARQCVENGMAIEPAQAAAGDVVFWKKPNCHCGRFMEIHHVGIYLGDGRVVEASSGKGGIVVRDIWETSEWNIAFYARVY